MIVIYLIKLIQIGLYYAFLDELKFERYEIIWLSL